MSYSKSRGKSSTSVKSSRSVTSSVSNPREGLSSFENIRQRNTSTNNQLQKRNEELNGKVDKSDTELTFKPWRIFINHIDSYHGKKLAETLSTITYIVGSRVSDAKNNARDEMGNRQSNEKNREDLSRTGSNVHDDFDEEENKHEEAEKNVSKSNRKFEVIGTVKDEEYKCPEHVTMVIRSSNNKKLLLRDLMKCGIVIYDITQDDSQISEARQALEGIVHELGKFRQEQPRAFELSRDTRYFILISTVMTWARTKPLNPDDPDLPLTEADYRKRKPHPNFKEHIKCEQEACTIAKRTNLNDKLKTVVLGSGITYGDVEGPIHYLFKMAWQNAEYLPIFGRGNNKIPLLDVRDLVEIVCMIVKKWPKLKYVIAVEQEAISQEAIVKKISEALTTGKVKRIPPAEAFLFPEITQRAYDIMNANITIEPAYIVDNELRWHREMPFIDNIDALVDEYKISRNLLPVKIIILGPPASGKTRLAKSLAKHYGIHYISVENLIKGTIEQLNKKIEGSSSAPDVTKGDSGKMELEEVEEDEEYEENDEDTARRVEEFQEQLDEIRTNLTENNGRLDDDILNKIFLERLLSHDCQNQGYVIDGYPKTISQARSLFSSNGYEEVIEQNEDDTPNTSVTHEGRKIVPELVVVLEAEDEFLIQRIVKLPEEEIQGTHYTEEEMLRRLKEYRERNTDEETPLQFFDELEVHPLVIAIDNDICPEMFPTFVQCIKRLGEPRNYGPSDAEREEAKKRVEVEALASRAVEEARKVREDFERKMAREKKMVEWTDLLEKLKKEEVEQLSIMGEPLRHYLVKYIFPTLSQGLIEVAKLRPDDPVDFLAEYLFKENPGGKMFEPDYTETMSMLLSAIDKLQENILPTSELDEETTKRYLKRREPRGDEGVSCRRRVTDEVGTLTDTDDDDGEYDDYRMRCDGSRRITTDDVGRGTSDSVVTTTIDNDKQKYHIKDETDALAASSFSYEELEEGSRKSFGNSSIHSQENLNDGSGSWA